MSSSSFSQKQQQQDLEDQTLKLSKLEADRDAKRKAIEVNLEERWDVQAKIDTLMAQKQILETTRRTLDSELHDLDERIVDLEQDIMDNHNHQGGKKTTTNSASQYTTTTIKNEDSSPVDDPKDCLAYAATANEENNGSEEAAGDFLTMNSDSPTQASAFAYQDSSSLPGPTDVDLSQDFSPTQPHSFFQPRRSDAPHDCLQHLSQMVRDQQQQQPQLQQSPSPSVDHHHYPWDNAIDKILHNVFKIPSFRTLQREVINTTLSKKDAFLLLRTGGGKSLSYQLPAIYEGRYNNKGTLPKQVTIVISPLLALIQDQETQLNHLCPQSTVSLTSDATRQELDAITERIVDPNGGVCLVLVTPERVVQSSNFQNYILQTLYSQQRLGRFVVDEAHCCTEQGHDFRPDFSQLGILKASFPGIPLLAVTATASPLVRADVCQILHLTNPQMYLSTSHRPNLHYQVRCKTTSVNDDMVEFIQAHHVNHTGIIYTLSRKEAEQMANHLASNGIVARPYHASLTKSFKKKVLQDWMAGRVHVVCSTIAFGLGINKPNVRFVLHHSISKTLEAYYQESGRAGRDGLPSDCILYYSPKDAFRLLGMITGTSAERTTFWPMVRYAQSHGGNALCHAILMTKLGDKDAPDPEKIDNLEFSRPTNITSHVKTVLQLIQSMSSKKTLAMILKEWRSKSPKLECLKNNPPNKDLTIDECERVLVFLTYSEVLVPQVSTNRKYGSSTVYLTLSSMGIQMMTSPTLSVTIPLPIIQAKKKKAADGTKKKAASTKKTVVGKKKPKAVKKKKSKKKAISLKKTGKKRALGEHNQLTLKSRGATTDVIELTDDSTSDDDDDDDVCLIDFKKPRRNTAAAVLEDHESSDEEFEFD